LVTTQEVKISFPFIPSDFIFMFLITQLLSINKENLTNDIINSVIRFVTLRKGAYVDVKVKTQESLKGVFVSYIYTKCLRKQTIQMSIISSSEMSFHCVALYSEVKMNRTWF
jgi:hypothetical protein